jgi:hypothetical protein
VELGGGVADGGVAELVAGLVAEGGPRHGSSVLGNPSLIPTIPKAWPLGNGEPHWGNEMSLPTEALMLVVAAAVALVVAPAPVEARAAAPSAVGAETANASVARNPNTLQRRMRTPSSVGARVAARGAPVHDG